MKKQIVLFGCILGSISVFSQTVLFEENFDSGIPGEWTQWSDDGIVWTADDALGTGGSGCAVVDQGESSEDGNAWLQTPFMDFSSATDLEITFSAALVRSVFITPSVSLWYDDGGGWEFLSNWGMEFGDFDNTIETTGPHGVPLGAEDVTWNTNLTFDLSEFDGVSSVRFSFGADYENGGWVLIDDVEITGMNSGTSGINQEDNQLVVYPNPSNGIFQIKNVNPEIDHVIVYDLLGKQQKTFQILNNGTGFLQIDLSDLEKQTYQISLFSGEEKQYTELITIK